MSVTRMENAVGGSSSWKKPTVSALNLLCSSILAQIVEASHGPAPRIMLRRQRLLSIKGVQHSFLAALVPNPGINSALYLTEFAQREHIDLRH